MKRKPSRSAGAPYRVPALERGLRILELLADAPGGQSIVDIADATRLPKPSVFRMLVTLHALEFLDKDPERGTYRLSRKMLRLGYAAIDGQGLVEKSADVLRTLRDESRESVLLAVLSGAEGVVLEQAASPLAVKVVVQIGHRFPLHTAAPGKALLAFLPREEQAAVLAGLKLKRFTATTITTRRALEAELARVKASGVAFDRGEEMEDIRCVAAPVLDHQRRPVAAISIGGPASRLHDDSLERLADLVRAHARVLRERLSP